MWRAQLSIVFPQVCPIETSAMSTAVSKQALRDERRMAWATPGTNRTVSFSRIYRNRDASDRDTVELRGWGTRALTRLLGAGYESKTGIKFGGKTLDGKLRSKFTQSGHPSWAVFP
jgi:hypothetical protein